MHQVILLLIIQAVRYDQIQTVSRTDVLLQNSDSQFPASSQVQGHCAAALRKMNLIASLFILGHVIFVKGHYDYMYYDYDYGDYDYYDYDMYDYYNDYFTCDQTDQDFCTWKTLWTDVQKPTAIAGTNLVKIDYDYFDILIDGAIAECAPSLGIKGNIKN